MVVCLGELTAEQVEAIRERLAAGESSVRAEAARYGVSPAYVSLIRTGQRRSDAGGPVVDAKPSVVLSDERVRELRDRWWGAVDRVALLEARIGELEAEIAEVRLTHQDLAAEFGVSRRYVKSLVEGDARGDAGGRTG